MSDVDAIYRKLYRRLWRHPGFMSLSDGEKVLALYLLTGPQTNRLGLYVLSIAMAAEDLGTLPQTLTKRFGKVCQTFGWLFEKGSRVVYIPSWFTWNPPENPNVMKGSLRDLNEIPPCRLIDVFARNVETLPVTLRQTFLEGLRQRSPTGMPNQEQDQEQDQEQEQEQEQERKSSALRARTPSADDNDEKNVDVITKLAHEAMDEFGTSQPGDLTEIVKSKCARYHVTYDSGTVAKAIDSARFQRQAVREPQRGHDRSHQGVRQCHS